MRNVVGWDRYFLDIAEAVAARSKDPRTQVGAVIVDDDHHIVSVGYNGFPPGVEETEDRWTPEQKGDYVVHAEVNALAHAQGVTKGTVLYVNAFPCSNCTRSLIAAGVTSVFFDYGKVKARLEGRPELLADYELSQRLLRESGVSYVGM